MRTFILLHESALARDASRPSQGLIGVVAARAMAWRHLYSRRVGRGKHGIDIVFHNLESLIGLLQLVQTQKISTNSTIMTILWTPTSICALITITDEG